MKKRLAILGAGHLGQQIAQYAIADNHYSQVLFFDDVVNETEVNGHRVIGKINQVKASFENKEFDELLIGIGYKHLDIRKELFERYFSNIPFGKIIHSSCWIDKTSIIKEGTVVYPSCCIDAHAVIGNNTILNIGCSIAHETVIGEHCFLSPRAAIAGFVTVGEQCIIGINATIIDNISIAAGTQLGGGTVVIKNITKSGLYIGNPSRYVR